MRKNRNVCPNCKAATEPGWQFCLACGETLRQEVVMVAPDPTVLSEKQQKDYQRGKVRCWQCQAKLTAPSPACPECGADLISARPTVRKVQSSEPTGMIGNLPMPLLLLFALMGAALVGAMGYMMSADNQSSASDGKEFNMPSLPDINFGSMFGDDEKAVFIPAGIGVNAIEGRAISVDDSGMITVRIEGKDIDVRPAGIADDYVDDCLGERGLARTRRIMTEGAIVYVYLDSPLRLVTQANVDPQSVYIWHFDPATEKLRFLNNEIIASGEAELQSTELTEDPASDLVASAARAEEKLRGRFEPGACL